NEDTIVSAQQTVKPMRAPSTRRKGTIKRMPTLREDSVVEEQERDEGDPSNVGLTPCVAGEFRAALDALFDTLSDTQNWFVFCVNPNDSQLPNQLEGRSVKGQVRSLGLPEIAKRNVNMFEVGMTLTSSVGGLLVPKRPSIPSRTISALLMSRNKSGTAFVTQRPKPEWTSVLLAIPTHLIHPPDSPGKTHPMWMPSTKNRHRHASPHEYDERKTFRSEDFDARSRLTSNRDESNSNYGTESYAPSRNMFQNADKEGLMVKEALAGEIMENETTEVVKETSARRRWTWREKLALNMVIWFICGCAIFVIAILGMVICPTQHVFSTSELASHSYQNLPNNVYTSIRGEVFDLTQIAATHQRVVSVVPTKSVLQYGGTAADNLFPVQVSALCNGISGTVSPWVQLNSANNTDVNAQYHDFRAITNDSRPDWYFESMTRCTDASPTPRTLTQHVRQPATQLPTPQPQMRRAPSHESQQAHHVSRRTCRISQWAAARGGRPKRPTKKTPRACRSRGSKEIESRATMTKPPEHVARGGARPRVERRGWTKPKAQQKDVATTPRTQEDDSSGDRDVHHTHAVPWNPQMASNDAADATNPNATSAGSTAPAGRLHKPNGKWRVMRGSRRRRTELRAQRTRASRSNRGGGKEVKNEDEEDSPSAPSTKPPSPSTSNQAPRPQGHR
ncbi:hypothetical protein BU15DRAFT_63271, partial [Melanogaster broomeanus]